MENRNKSTNGILWGILITIIIIGIMYAFKTYIFLSHNNKRKPTAIETKIDSTSLVKIDSLYRGAKLLEEFLKNYNFT